MATPDSVDRITTRAPRGSRADVIAPVVLGALALGAALIYAVLWSKAITGDAYLGSLQELPWLHAHVLLYSLGNALLIGTLGLSIHFWLTATSTRVPWLELAVLAISILFIAGVYTGFQFARPVWGFNPWSSDGKLLSAISAAALTALVVLPLAAWMRLRVQPSRRHLLLACCLLVVAGLAALSFFYPGRTIHPDGRLVP